MRGYEMAIVLRDKGVTLEDVKAEVAYRKETGAKSNEPQNEAFVNMTLNELVRVTEMWALSE